MLFERLSSSVPSVHANSLVLFRCRWQFFERSNILVSCSISPTELWYFCFVSLSSCCKAHIVDSIPSTSSSNWSTKSFNSKGKGNLSKALGKANYFKRSRRVKKNSEPQEQMKLKRRRKKRRKIKEWHIKLFLSHKQFSRNCAIDKRSFLGTGYFEKSNLIECNICYVMDKMIRPKLLHVEKARKKKTAMKSLLERYFSLIVIKATNCSVVIISFHINHSVCLVVTN